MPTGMPSPTEEGPWAWNLEACKAVAIPSDEKG